MAFKIVWSEIAKLDRKEIFTYWNNRNKSNEFSKKLNNLFNAHIDTLYLHPNIGKLTNKNNVRFLIVRDYLIFYEVTINQISILRIWDSRRNPEKIKNSIQ